MSDTNFAEYLPYIDVNEGLSRVLKNKKLYARLLKSYLASTSIDPVSVYLQSGDMPAARDAVHSIKGVSANLSITKTFEFSRDLEANIKNGEDYAQSFLLLKDCLETTKPLIEKLIAELETI